MKREEKNQQTRRRILDGALAEFSRQGYGGSSINTICAAQNISKGIIYHYFDTKDALFLACVEECFDLLTDHLRKQTQFVQGDSEERLAQYFGARMAFFKEKPIYQRIFCEVIISPPNHLRNEIQTCRQGFDALNIQILEQLLAPLTLRPQVTKAEVIDTFQQFQDFINARFRASEMSLEEFEDRERRNWKALNILLYGVVERKEKNNA